MSAPSEPARALKIKTGSVRRLTKELETYTAEAAAEEAKVAAMRAAGAEAHDLKHAVRGGRGRKKGGGGVRSGRVVAPTPPPCSFPSRLTHARPRLYFMLQENVLSEAALMVPDTRSRLEAALADLEGVLVRQRDGGSASDLVSLGARLLALSLSLLHISLPSRSTPPPTPPHPQTPVPLSLSPL